MTSLEFTWVPDRCLLWFLVPFPDPHYTIPGSGNEVIAIRVQSASFPGAWPSFRHLPVPHGGHKWQSWEQGEWITRRECASLLGPLMHLSLSGLSWAHTRCNSPLKWGYSLASFPGSHAPEHKHWSCVGMESLVFFLTWGSSKNDLHASTSKRIQREPYVCME